MNLKAFRNSHILIALWLIATPSVAQTTFETTLEEGEDTTGLEDNVEVQDNSTDTALNDETEAELATPQRRQPRQPATIKRDNTDKYLGILGLLFLWLLTRKENERKEIRARPTRQAPLTAEELGRAIYSVARSADLTGFRTLHIDGKEAGEALGVDKATQYLRDRTQDKLAQDMSELSEKIPMGAQYKSCKINRDLITITLITSTGEEVRLEAGKVLQVGAILRLV
jgi:hypothetical protein